MGARKHERAIALPLLSLLSVSLAVLSALLVRRMLELQRSFRQLAQDPSASRPRLASGPRKHPTRGEIEIEAEAIEIEQDGDAAAYLGKLSELQARRVPACPEEFRRVSPQASPAVCLLASAQYVQSDLPLFIKGLDAAVEDAPTFIRGAHQAYREGLSRVQEAAAQLLTSPSSESSRSYDEAWSREELLWQEWMQEVDCLRAL